MKIKKIAILYSGGRYFGGIEQYLVNLFKSVDKKDIELELLSMGEWDLTKHLINGGYGVRIFSQKRISPKTVRLVGDYLKENNFDLLVSQGTVANAYARAVSLFYKIPNLVTVHSTHGGDYSNSLVSGLYGLVDRLTRFATAEYIAVSNHLKSEMIKSGVRAEKITVIYNGTNFCQPNPKRHKNKVIGSVGRLHPVKGYDLLIQALAKLNNKDIILKIAGDGPELNHLKSLAKEFGVEDRVKFVGFKKDVYEFLNTIDIYIQTSLSEGFGLSVIEAMSQGLPVVVTPAGSLCEIVKHNKTGIISRDMWPENIAEAITKILDDKTMANKLGKNGRDFVIANFNIKHWADKTINTYKRSAK